MTPDPQTVREIAREHIRSGIADIGTTIVKYFGNGALGDEECGDWYHAVVQAWRIELRAVSWPDEQQPADPVTAGQQQGGAVGRVEAIRARWESTGFRALSDGQIDELIKFLLDQLADFPAAIARAKSAEGAWSAQQEIIQAERRRAEQIEAERNALAARVAELESERETVPATWRFPCASDFDGEES